MIITGKKFSKPEMSRVINGDVELPAEAEAIPKERLDLLLVKKYPSYNRSTLQKFIEKGFVMVDGVVVLKANQKFGPEAMLWLKVPEEMKNADIEPEIIYEDENVLVVNKPAGLLSMAKEGYCPEKTLADYGMVVHRLDRDTSGVMILAKNKETAGFLQRQFQERKVHKTYFAVVNGRPKLDAARIDLPIARDLKRPNTFRVDPSGKVSETFYRVIKSDGVHSLVELKPTTGRTHQLRVHLSYLGTPIVGDPLYGEAGPNGDDWARGDAERLMLHAGELEITIPGADGSVRKVFTVPRPEEFDAMIGDADSGDDMGASDGGI